MGDEPEPSKRKIKERTAKQWKAQRVPKPGGRGRCVLGCVEPAGVRVGKEQGWAGGRLLKFSLRGRMTQGPFEPRSAVPENHTTWKQIPSPFDFRSLSFGETEAQSMSMNKAISHSGKATGSHQHFHQREKHLGLLQYPCEGKALLYSVSSREPCLFEVTQGVVSGWLSLHHHSGWLQEADSAKSGLLFPTGLKNTSRCPQLANRAYQQVFA